MKHLMKFNESLELLDDLKANFRNWEESTYADIDELINDTEELINIMKERHPDVEPKHVEKTCQDWMGLDEWETSDTLRNVNKKTSLFDE